jgi:hypothetical protein
VIGWGIFLLAAYLVLGLSRVRIAKAIAVVVCLTALVVLVVIGGASP